jgi:hypothetical protein
MTMRNTNCDQKCQALFEIALKSFPEAIKSLGATKITSNFETSKSRENFR